MTKFSVQTFVFCNSGTHFFLYSKNITFLCRPISMSLPIVLLVSQNLKNTEIQDSDYLNINLKSNNKINFNPEGN